MWGNLGAHSGLSDSALGMGPNAVTVRGRGRRWEPPQPRLCRTLCWALVHPQRPSEPALSTYHIGFLQSPAECGFKGP